MILWAVLLCTPAFAKHSSTPDLSGTWVLNLTKSTPAKNGTRDSETVVIECSGENVHITYKTTAGKQSEEMWVANGQNFLDKQLAGGSLLYHRAQWKRTVLVTEKDSDTPIAVGTKHLALEKNRWSLSSDGRVLTREVEDPPQTLVYDKP
jgi:hypothetical protein